MVCGVIQAAHAARLCFRLFYSSQEPNAISFPPCLFDDVSHSHTFGCAKDSDRLAVCTILRTYVILGHIYPYKVHNSPLD